LRPRVQIVSEQVAAIVQALATGRCRHVESRPVSSLAADTRREPTGLVSATSTRETSLHFTQTDHQIFTQQFASHTHNSFLDAFCPLHSSKLEPLQAIATTLCRADVFPIVQLTALKH